VQGTGFYYGELWYSVLIQQHSLNVRVGVSGAGNSSHVFMYPCVHPAVLKRIKKCMVGI
jgi:hypothetical protein